MFTKLCEVVVEEYVLRICEYSPPGKSNTKMCVRTELVKSDPKRIHSLLSAHLYSFLGKGSKIVLELFLSSSTQQHEKWDCKAKNQTQHLFSRKVKICQAHFQLQKYFPVFSLLPLTAVLQRCYLVTDDKEGNSMNKIPIPKI